MRRVAVLMATLLLLGSATRAQAAFRAALVDPEDVTERQHGGEQMLIVDIRTPGAYKDEHIFGACNVPFASLARMPRGLSKTRTLVLYCTCPEEHGSFQAAATLHDRFGFSKLVVLRGGLDAWREAGYKVVEAPVAQPFGPPAAPAPKFRPASPVPRVIAASTAPAFRPASPLPTPSGAPGTPMPIPSFSPVPAHDQRVPIDEQRRGSQSS
jgi:rhodanese-related sulfurtransferase